VRSGKLRFRLTLQNPVYPVPATLNAEPSFSTGDSFSADVEDLGEQERAFAGQQGAVITHRITARWNEITAQISTKSRLVMGTRTFHVTRVQNVDSRNREIQIDAAEKV